MKKIISAILALCLLVSMTISLTSCGDDDCFACGGSGYYQKRDCPFC